MDPICGKCCGIDVHKKKLAVCLLNPVTAKKPVREIREFRTTTKAIRELKSWLETEGV